MSNEEKGLMEIQNLDLGSLGSYKDLNELRNKAISYGLTILGKYTNIETQIEIEISKNGLNKFLRKKTYLEYSLITILPDLLVKATIYKSESDKRNRPEIQNIHRFRINVDVKEERKIVEIVVRETNEGFKFYDAHIKKTG